MSDYIATAAEVVKSLVSQRSSRPSANGGSDTPGHVKLGEATGYQAATLDIEGGASIKCWFNPTQYSVTRTNTWNVKQPAVGKKGAPKAQFGGGQPRELSLDLLFDASDSTKDVRKEVIEKLFEMMEPNASFASAQSKKSARPPIVTFTWGEVVLKAVAKSLNVQYTLFHPDGKPIRAAVKITLMEVPQGGLDGQNPTTRGEVLRAHVVRDGDSLQSIAYTAYQDATRWRAIAEANGIDDPLSLERGRALAIPRLEG